MPDVARRCGNLPWPTKCARGGLCEAEVMAKAADLVRILRRSIAQGIAGTHYDDRILGHQSGTFQQRMPRAACSTAAR